MIGLWSEFMRFISEIQKKKAESGQPVLSVEFFPPKTDKGMETLFDQTLKDLDTLDLDFCSVTYGAGGSTSDKTLDMVRRIQESLQIPAMMHLTCVNSTRSQLAEVVDKAVEGGIQNILALRGDPPGGTGEFVATEGGFEYSYQLVDYLKKRGGLCIGTAGFPEGHIHCRDGKKADWDHLVNKINHGADFVVTQLFFDNRDFFEFRDYVNGKLGREIPFEVGVLPVVSGKQLRKFTELCGSSIPAPMMARLDELGDDDEAVTEFGIEYATRQLEELIREKVSGIHFYCLNKSYSTLKVCENLGLKGSRGK